MHSTAEETKQDFKSDLQAQSYVSDFYAHMPTEMEKAGYSRTEREAMLDPVLYYGRYLNDRVRPYFEKTVIPVIGNAVHWFGRNSGGKVLDLGCGLGMQSLIFAALGKEVLAVDIRPESISLCKKRQRYYEDLLGRPLDIEFKCIDFLELDATREANSFDGVFSMSAFSYIKPLQQSVARVGQLATHGARVFLFEENAANFYARSIRRRDLPMPAEIVAQFEEIGFDLDSLEGTCAVPKQAWIFPKANKLVTSVDRMLRRSMLLSFSYALRMTKQRAGEH